MKAHTSSSYIFGVLRTVYGITMIELMVRRNNVGPGEKAWSFGQIFSILITISSLNEVLHWCMSNRNRKIMFMPF